MSKNQLFASASTPCHVSGAAELLTRQQWTAVQLQSGARSECKETDVWIYFTAGIDANAHYPKEQQKEVSMINDSNTC